MQENKRVIVIHYNEVALKGGNRGRFESVLIRNIKKALDGEKYGELKKKSTRIILYLNADSDQDSILAKLKCIFGIQWFAFGFSVAKEIEEIKNAAIEIAAIYKGKSIKLETKRQDKAFALKSMELNKKIGQELEAAGFAVDLDNPQILMHMEILDNEALILSDKIQGVGGLPSGTSGRVLCLLSGGIDSPAAAWLMMKRGCIVDFLHVAQDNEMENIGKSKIVRVLGQLKQYYPLPIRLYAASYSEFYQKTFDMEGRSELVVFKRFLLRIAERLCREKNYLGIVTGDAVAQVASQTLDNLFTTNAVTNLPVYRPLAGYDKDDIVRLAKIIGTFDVSIEKYKDCCSLVATKHPSTRTKIEDAEKSEAKMGINEVVEKTLAKLGIVDI